MPKDRPGIFINTTDRPDVPKVIEELKAATGITTNVEIVCQALRHWLKQVRRDEAKHKKVVAH